MNYKKFTIKGLVQGIGFRPFVAELADELNIVGYVRNSGGIVTVVAGGEPKVLENFERRIADEVPTGGFVSDLQVSENLSRSQVQTLSAAMDKKFVIIQSDSDDEKNLPVMPADIATCDRCIEELLDEKNRRYRHPFISCTVCGPRYSILKKLPYDRETITMGDFELCQECEREYKMPKNIRRHAQTIACKSCGPKLTAIKVKDGKKEILSNTFCRSNSNLAKIQKSPKANFDSYELIKQAAAIIADGGIVAIKDIGGYHLACNPFDEVAVAKLRMLKHREEKAFAVMFPELSDVEEFCELGDKEKEILTSPARPIVLLRQRNIKKDQGCEGAVDNNSCFYIDMNMAETEKRFAQNVCCSSPDIGAMLPCNPLQILLLQLTGPLIMTSGNGSGDVLEIDDAAMVDWLACRSSDEELLGVSLLVLSHDRQILRPLDDSIVKVVRGRRQIIRRARGYAPSPIPVGISGECFAAGGDLKSSFCFVKNGFAYLSQYLGDQVTMSCQNFYKQELSAMTEIFGFEPQKIITDKHPGYFSRQVVSEIFEKEVKSSKTQYQIKSLDGDNVKNTDNNQHVIFDEIQHHMSHVASVIAEKSLKGKVLGFAFDGTGYGDDGTIWGSEVFLWDEKKMNRVAHLKPVRLIGGDEGAKNCQTILDGYLFSIKEELEAADLKDFIPDNLVTKAISMGINTVTSSSMGRLFDAVSCLLGICDYNTYEGQAPMKLEWCAKENMSPNLLEEISVDGDTSKLLISIIGSIKAGVDRSKIAYDFIDIVARFILKQSQKYIGETRQVVLSGGTFLNRILLERAIDYLEAEGFEVCISENVPTNDGGICLGQAYLGCKCADDVYRRK